MWHEMRCLPGVAGRPGSGAARARGNIETLRSGALRVRVYAGIDPVTKKRHNLIEVVPPGPKAWRQAEKIRDRFLYEVAERRNPRTSATVDQLLALCQTKIPVSTQTARAMIKPISPTPPPPWGMGMWGSVCGW